MRVLGPIEVRVDGRSRRLGPPKQRALLALLLLHDVKVVPAERITEELWGESPPASATANLRTYAAGLRRMLPSADRHRLVARPAGYLLNVAPDEVDAAEFELWATRGRRALDDGDPTTAARELERALSLWRGHVGEDLRAGPVLTPLIEVLEERRRGVLEDFIEARLVLGECAQVIPQLRTITATHPLRERAWALLMRALSAAGDPAAALETYTTARRTLVTTLGIEPGVELRRLHRMILNAEPADTPARGSARCESWWARCQLPAQARGFVGREHDIEEIAAGLLSEPRELVTVTGPPGVGKSAVAVAVAHRLRPHFPDGQWFVRLHGKGPRPRPPAEVLDELLRVCGDADDLPESTERRAAFLRGRLADRRVLIVLDDAGSAGQVRPLLPGTASSAVIVTSRDALPGLIALDGARVRRLTTLCPALSRQLLTGLLGDETMTAHRAAADNVLQICAGLPLALRIAAANISAAGGDIAAYAARLRGGDPLSALADDGDGQVALRRSFELSYRRLPDDARRLFRLMGTIAAPELSPGLGLDGVAALYGTDQDTARQVLARLAAASLAERCPDGRYRLHELLRLYARERANAEEPALARSEALARLQTRLPRSISRGRQRPWPLPVSYPAASLADPVDDRAV